MALQNVQSGGEVIRSQNFFRLKQELQSSGDIFEIDTGTRAIYMGPDSDISEAQITYYSPLEPGSLQTANISPGAPFIGRLDSFNTTVVPSTGLPARVLVSPRDLINNTPFAAAGVTQFVVKPRIDIISSLTEQPNVPILRSDLTARFGAVSYSAAANAEITFPVYNRRLVSVVVRIPAFESAKVTYTGTTLSAGGNTGRTTLEIVDVAAFGLRQQLIRSFGSTSPEVGSLPATTIFGAKLGVNDLFSVKLEPLFPDVGPFTAQVTIRASDREA